MAIRLPRLRINRSLGLLVMSLALGGVAVWATYTYLKASEERIQVETQNRLSGGQTVQVVVPPAELKRGTVVNDSNMVTRDIPADLAYADTVLFADWDKFRGKVLVRNLLPGRPVRFADLEEPPSDFADMLNPGKRAITIDIDEMNSIAGMLKPGNVVDIFVLVPNANGAGERMVNVVERAKVVATGQTLRQPPLDAVPAKDSETGPKPGASYSNVTFEASIEDASRIALAQNLGRIRALLRNEKDQERSDYTPVTSDMVLKGSFAKGKKEKEERTIAYYFGGSGTGGTAPPTNIAIPGLPGFPAAPAAAAAGRATAPRAPVQAAPGAIAAPAAPVAAPPALTYNPPTPR